EIAMAGGDDPDNRRDFPGGFPGMSRDAFTASGRTADENEVFSTVKSLLTLRREHSALQRGTQTHIAWDSDYYAFLRADSRERLLVIFNNSAGARTLTIALADTPLDAAQGFEPLLGAQPVQKSGAAVSVPIAATSVSIYSVK
ncbi:MAG: hypothetical protein JO187_09750, partial [Acidobacteria bacterium]|nr:hypothetical protein [Acidobacteriota bacterium]